MTGCYPAILRYLSTQEHTFYRISLAVGKKELNVWPLLLRLLDFKSISTGTKDVDLLKEVLGELKDRFSSTYSNSKYMPWISTLKGSMRAKNKTGMS